MEKVMEFLRDKYYYVIFIFCILLVFIIIIVSCSNKSGKGNEYNQIEDKMIVGAKSYYKSHNKDLPKEEGDTVSLKLSYLVEKDYVKKIKDPKNKDNSCSGSVSTTKRGNNYYYVANLNCGKNYKTKFLKDAVKSNLKVDSKGNGLYVNGDEYIFKGDILKNYVSFNDSLWRIMKIDKDGDIKLISYTTETESYTWDDRFNVATEGNDGINNFKMSRLKDTLLKYYKKNFNNVAGAKENIVKKDFCTGLRKETDDIIGTAECSSTTPLYVGLINTSEFYMATLDTTCTKFGQEQCANYNYLANNENTSWTLTGSATDSSRVYNYYDEIVEVDASYDARIYPVIYIDSKTTISKGTGARSNPYVVN